MAYKKLTKESVGSDWLIIKELCIFAKTVNFDYIKKANLKNILKKIVFFCKTSQFVVYYF